MDKTILSILMWLFLLGGLFGMITGLVKFIQNGTPAEFGVMGVGGGFWLLSCAIVIYFRHKMENK